MRRKECIAVLKESQIPTRWMRAYISIYLIALLVQLASLMLSTGGLLLFAKDLLVDPLLTMTLSSGALTLLICTAIAYHSMIHLRPSAFVWCVVHLILSAVYWTGSATLSLVPAYDSAGIGYAPYAAIFFVIYMGGWVAPNYLYFNKRRELFRVYTPREIAFAMSQWHSLS